MKSRNLTPAILSLTMPFYPIRSTYDRRTLFPMDSPALAEEYVKALRREIRQSAPDYAEFEIRAVRVGGGIAGHAADEALGLLLRELHEWFSFSPDPQISLNVHPGMVSAETLLACARGRVNWLRVDYVTADPFESEAMKRFLPPSAMDTTMLVLKGSDLRLSFDVLIGLPGQSEASLEITLNRVIGCGAEEIVLHRLEAIPGTVFADRDIIRYRDSVSPRLKLPDDAACRDLFHFAKQHMSERGFTPAAPNIFARNGVSSVFDALDSQGCPRIGFGLGAKTRMDGILALNTRDMDLYLRHSGEPDKITASVLPYRQG